MSEYAEGYDDDTSGPIALDPAYRAHIAATVASDPCAAPEVCTGDCSDCPTLPDYGVSAALIEAEHAIEKEES